MVKRNPPELIRPDWPAPGNILAFSTTRKGGYSTGRWSSLNLGARCGDDPLHVTDNQILLLRSLPAVPVWLSQVHGCRVVTLGEHADAEPEADASIARTTGQVCAILSADCLPVLLCDRQGTEVAAAHAGWRGLAAGVLQATVSRMECHPENLMAWLGPAIGPKAFEVGDEVLEAFVNANSENSSAFVRHGNRWLADLYALARMILSRRGVGMISGGKFCTFTESDRFFSYRRDGTTGRNASLIWIKDSTETS